MLHFSALLLAFSVAGSVTAAPTTQLNRRIAQDISASTKKWEAACDTARGGDKCNQIAVKAFGGLLAGAGACDQQNSADDMMDLSKQLKSNNMISLAQIFCQQPRNSPNSLSVPYCQQKPRNAELNGLFQCQFQGVNPTKFADGSSIGAPGTMPFGQNTPVNPPGSCPANPAGPIAAGQQLTDLVQSPGVPAASGAGNGTAQSASSATPSAAVSAAQPTASSAASSATPRAVSAGFKAQNGKDAQALNEKFKGLTPNSPCTAGEQACVNGQFAQCVAGKFSLTPCASGLQCSALPLVNKPGTSVSCDTAADSTARINTALNSRAVAASFKAQNGKDAQALNQKFAGLTANSPCTAGEQACVNGQFAQCVAGKFSLTPCSGGLKCTALPLVNKPGTSVTCDTAADSAARIAAALGS